MTFLSKKQIKKICKLLEKGESSKIIAEKMNVSWSTVNRIRKRTTHTDISSKYNF